VAKGFAQAPAFLPPQARGHDGAAREGDRRGNARPRRRGDGNCIPRWYYRTHTRTELLHADEALFAPVFLLVGGVVDRQEQMLYVAKIEPAPRNPLQIVFYPL
jgi:hypothetical protein